MKSLFSKLVLILLFSSSLHSCYRLTTDIDTEQAVYLNEQYPNASTGAFSEDGVHVFLFWGLVGNENEALKEAMARPLQKGRALQEVKVRTFFSVGDMLVSVITLGLVTPRSYHIEGEYVK